MDKDTKTILKEKKSSEILNKEYICTISDKIQSLINDDGIAPHDIMVMVQRRIPFAAPLVKELKIRGINVAGSDRIILPKFPAIRDLLNIVRFCLDISDDYSLCCILKSPFYRLNERDIFNICSLKNQANKTHNTPNQTVPPMTVFDGLKTCHPDIFQELTAVIELSKVLAPYSFFMHLLNENNYREKMIAALGVQIIDPLEEFLTICLSYERTQPGTLRHFLKYFITGDSEIKRDMDTSEGVRIVTVHGSKGLEAPVVFLIDTVSTPQNENIFPIEQDMLDKKIKIPTELILNSSKLDLWLWSPKKDHNSVKSSVAEDRTTKIKMAEYYRLLYVAMTRARDRLYIYAPGKSTKTPGYSWYAQLTQVLSQMPGIQSVNGVIRISNEQ